MAAVYVVMGVSGSGKTTIGKKLAERLDLPFYDADDFHPAANIDKMAAGHSLEDTDRWPWLDTLAKEIVAWSEQRGAVLACSALKEVYRERLFVGAQALARARQCFIYLDAPFDVIKARLALREHHFFDVRLLQSQYDTLEIPNYGIHINVTPTEDDTIKEILATLNH